MKLLYVVVSEYAGEQGHFGGGSVIEHFKTLDVDEAFQFIEQNKANHVLDYRSPRVEVRQERVFG